MFKARCYSEKRVVTFGPIIPFLILTQQSFHRPTSTNSTV